MSSIGEHTNPAMQIVDSESYEKRAVKRAVGAETYEKKNSYEADPGALSPASQGYAEYSSSTPRPVSHGKWK
jgi:hypothetical protein